MYEKLKISELRVMLNDPSHKKNRSLILNEIKNRMVICTICCQPAPWFTKGCYGPVCRTCMMLGEKDTNELFRWYDDDMEGHD